MVGPFAYDTQIANINGVALHLWTMTDAEPNEAMRDNIARAYSIMRNHRDIVWASYSIGKPAGFWARQDIE